KNDLTAILMQRPAPPLDGARCTSRQLRFTATVQWYDNFQDIHTELDTGYELRVLLGDDNANTEQLHGTYFTISGGIVPEYIVYNSTEFAYPYLAVGATQFAATCQSRVRMNTNCQWVERKDLPRIRGGRLQLAAVANIDANAKTLRVDTFTAHWFNTSTDSYELLFNFKNAAGGAGLPPVSGARWLGAGSADPIFSIVTRRVDMRVSDYSLEMVDTCQASANTLAQTTSHSGRAHTTAAIVASTGSTVPATQTPPTGTNPATGATPNESSETPPTKRSG